jgi:hypothetical protein
MAKKKSGNMLGGWSFLIGVILAVVFGFLGPLSQTLVYVLFVLGVIIGLLNISDEESTPFMMAGVVLVIVGTLGQSVVSSVSLFDRILSALTLLFIPATIIVALKSVFEMAKR